MLLPFSLLSCLGPHLISSSIFSDYINENYLPVNTTVKAATVTGPTPRVKFLNYEIPIKKNIWCVVCVTHQQSLALPSSRFFLPCLPGQFEAVTPRQHQGSCKRKWQEQDVQNISNVRAAVPRHVLLHSRVLTWRLRARAGAFQGPGLFVYLHGGPGKRTRTLLVTKARRLPKTKKILFSPKLRIWRWGQDA